MHKAFQKSITIPMKQSLELSYNNRNNPKRLTSLYFSAEVGEWTLGM